MVELAFPDLTLKKDERIIAGLSTLLFSSVIGYFATRLKDICVKSWSRPLISNSSLRHCLFWIVKTIMEWLKAVIIIVCLREQGINFRLRLLTTVITFTYYMCTEKIFTEIIKDGITYFSFEKLENLEHLIVPIILNIYTILSSSVVIIKLLFTTETKGALIASYFLVYLRIKDLIYNYLNVLILERKTYATFRPATDKDIQQWDDICAVCLNRMSRARITPCNHLFHPYCLKQCLKSSYQCPLCKSDFVK